MLKLGKEHWLIALSPFIKMHYKYYIVYLLFIFQHISSLLHGLRNIICLAQFENAALQPKSHIVSYSKLMCGDFSCSFDFFSFRRRGCDIHCILHRLRQHRDIASIWFIRDRIRVVYYSSTSLSLLSGLCKNNHIIAWKPFSQPIMIIHMEVLITLQSNYFSVYYILC